MWSVKRSKDSVTEASRGGGAGGGGGGGFCNKLRAEPDDIECGCLLDELQRRPWAPP